MSDQSSSLPQYSTEHYPQDQLPKYFDHPEYRDAELAHIWARLQISPEQADSSAAASSHSSESPSSSRMNSVSTGQSSSLAAVPPRYSANYAPSISSEETTYQGRLGTSLQKARAKLPRGLGGAALPVLDEEQQLALRKAKAEKKLKEKREMERYRREEMRKYCVLAVGGSG